jgi:DNA-binding MarR family transcriptional regulator
MHLLSDGAEEMMDPHDFKNCTCFNLRKATRALTQIYDEALRPIGLGANQVAILSVVEATGTVGMSDLAQNLVMDRTTLTRNLKPLLDAGYLTSSEGKDRRRRLIALTQKGKRVLTDAVPLWQDVQTRVANALGHNRWARLLGDLQHVTRLS